MKYPSAAKERTSFLPDWYGFNRAILEEAKTCALRGLPTLDDKARAGLQSLAIEQIPVEAFSDLWSGPLGADGLVVLN